MELIIEKNNIKVTASWILINDDAQVIAIDPIDRNQWSRAIQAGNVPLLLISAQFGRGCQYSLHPWEDQHRLSPPLVPSNPLWLWLVKHARDRNVMLGHDSFNSCPQEGRVIDNHAVKKWGNRLIHKYNMLEGPNSLINKLVLLLRWRCYKITLVVVRHF